MPKTLHLRTDIPPQDLLVIALISSRRIVGLVALMNREFGTKTVAHHAAEIDWEGLEEFERITALRSVVKKVCDSAGIEPRSIYLSRSESSIGSRTVVGDIDFQGMPMRITDAELEWALRRAEEKRPSTDQEVIDCIPVRWEIHGVTGGGSRISRQLEPAVEVKAESKAEARAAKADAKATWPLGETCTSLSVHAVQIITRAGYRQDLQRLADALGLELDGVIAQPAALYRGIQSRLSSHGFSLVIDCGARHTSFLLRHGERLLKVLTYDFGGDHLTRRLVDELKIAPELAEQLKREIDITAAAGESGGQQLIWTDVVARIHELAPRAAAVCRTAISDFFAARAAELQEDPENALPRKGHIHLVGRASQLGGLVPALKEIFGLDVVLGSGGGKRDQRDPGEELSNLLSSGLIVSAIDQRRAAILREGTGIRAKASGLWSWLTRRFE